MGRAGYRVVAARTGPDALRRFYDEHPTSSILDVARARPRWLAAHRALPRVQPGPDPDGHRARSEAEKVRGLKLGRRRLHHQAASLPELTARVEAALRRAATAPRAAAPAAASRPGRRPRRAPRPAAAATRSPDADGVPAARLPGEHAGQLVDASSGPAARSGAPATTGDVHLLRMTIRNLRLKPGRGGSGRVVHRDRVRARLQAHRSVRDPGQALSHVEGSPR